MYNIIYIEYYYVSYNLIRKYGLLDALGDLRSSYLNEAYDQIWRHHFSMWFYDLTGRHGEAILDAYRSYQIWFLAR